MPSLALLLQRHLWVSSRKLARKHLVQAKQLLASQDPPDIHTALGLLDAALKLFPEWEKAIELKARAFLSLRRFRDIANLLQESIPSLKGHPAFVQNAAEEKISLLPAYSHPPASSKRIQKPPFAQCFSLFAFQRSPWVRCISKGDREQWRFTVLGVACCHLGMMEDAMILLSCSKRAASAAHRKLSSKFNEDFFFPDGTQSTGDVGLVNQLLGNIKTLVRRRTAALAALDAGLYTEAARHFSKIIDGRRGTPQGFIAECYMHRAVAYQSTSKIIDALVDCNRSIALNPLCAEALSTRANLYEAIGCLTDSSQDLEKLKGLYEIICRNNMQWVHGQQSSAGADLQGCIDFIKGRIASISQRVAGRSSMMDHFGILGVSRGCSRQEVERAYLILSLKHRPDRAAHFVDRCEFVDERDIEAVKDEARALGIKTFKLLQKSYTWIMSLILEEEMSRVRFIQESDMAPKEHSLEGSLRASWKGTHPAQHVMYDSGFFSISEAAQSLFVKDNASAVSTIDVRLTQQEGDQIEALSRTAYLHDMLEAKGLEDFSDLDPFGDVGHLLDATLFAQILKCSESVSVGTIVSQGLSSEAWMCANDWNHQGRSTHALSVT